MIGLKNDIFWIASGQIFGIVNNFLLLKVLTDNLSIASYGYFSLWISFALFARQIIYDPISIVAAKEVVSLSSVHDSNFNYFDVVKYLTDRLMIGFILIGFLSLFYELVFYGKILFSLYILIGCIYLVANGAQGIYLNMLNTLKVRKLAAIGIIADSLLKLCLVFSVFFLIDGTFMHALIAVAASSMIVFIIVQRISRQFDNQYFQIKNQKWPPTKQLIILSIPFVAPCILTAIKGIGDKVFMASFIGIEQLAAYNVLLQLGFIPMMLVVGVIQTYVSPDIYKFATRDYCANNRNLLIFIQGILKRIAIMSMLAITVSIFSSDIIFKYMVSEKYLDYGSLLPYFVLAGSVSGIAGLLNVIAIGLFKSKRVSSLMLFSILAGLVIMMISIIAAGFQGAIIGLILSNLIIIFIFGASIYNALSDKS